MKHAIVFLLLLLSVANPPNCNGGDWPRFRGPEGNAVVEGITIPVEWSPSKHIHWKTAIPGEGSSSPIVWGERIFITSASEKGARRALHCLDRAAGKLLWSRETADPAPEHASAVTGHAAATPATDGQRVIAFFGNAGIVCFDYQGKQLGHRRLGEFDSELGLASSPIIDSSRVFLVCDHDGTRFTSFDSFLVALDLQTGKELWKTARPGLERSWSTPTVVSPPIAMGGLGNELIVSAQDELRAYDPETGKQLWTVTGLTGWVAPSPVFGHGLVFATSGKTGPVLAVRPGGRGDVTSSHVVWNQENVGPYVCSPLLYGDQLYVANEMGVLSCYEAKTGKLRYRERLGGKFTASPVGGADRVYLTNEDGVTFVLQSGPRFALLGKNSLLEYCVASPAISRGELFIRTEKGLWCVGSK